MAISGILIPLDGAAISAAILPVVASLARPIHASVHLFAAIDLQKREIQSLCYTADGDASPVERTAGPESAPLNPSGFKQAQPRSLDAWSAHAHFLAPWRPAFRRSASRVAMRPALAIR